MFPFEQGAFEMVVIGALALIIVGPKDLPVLMRKVGQFTAKMRGMAAEFRASFDELARQSELDELRREVEALRTGAYTALQDPAPGDAAYVTPALDAPSDHGRAHAGFEGAAPYGGEVIPPPIDAVPPSQDLAYPDPQVSAPRRKSRAVKGVGSKLADSSAQDGAAGAAPTANGAARRRSPRASTAIKTDDQEPAG